MPSIVKLMKNPAKIIYVLDKLKISRLMTDKTYLKMRFRASIGKKLDLQNPRTYNEKLNWLKINDRNCEYTRMVDKYEVKKYVANIIGEEYIVPTLGVWEKFDDINFHKLPNQFVLKCTHDSGGVVICKNKTEFDVDQARKIINKSLKRNFYKVAREWPYKNVKPRIIAEHYMEDSETEELRDYKFFTFDGEAKMIFIATERQKQGVEVKFDFFDMKFNHLPFTNGHPNADSIPTKPKCFEEMVVLAEKLSVGIPHVRVDFYEVNGKVYFGELTFYHFGGFQPFDPDIWDYTMGEYIKLPKK